MSSEDRGLTAAAVMRMARAHLAERATSRSNLRRVLARRIRRWHETRELPPPEETVVAALIDDVLARLDRAGVVDDAAYAASRARGLVAKGLPAWRIRRELEEDGLDPTVEGLEALVAPEAELQGRRFAERKRLGPFRIGSRSLHRDKDIRAMVRAGFAVRLAMAIIDADAEPFLDGSASDPTEES